MVLLMQGATIDGLNDIVTPVPVAWTPETIGWWVVGGIVLAVVAWTIWSAIRRTRANRYRVAALAELDRIERLAADPTLRNEGLRALPALVKRTALAVAPRRDVASLTGDRLLAFLDASYPGSAFSNGAGPLLVDAPYWTDERLARVDDTECAKVIAAVRRWIRTHRVEIPNV